MPDRFGAASPGDGALRILHCFRAPVGGLFRHVVDLAREQARRGHRVGLVCDSTTARPASEETLAELGASMALGVHRMPMAREPGFGDVRTATRVGRLLEAHRADIVHGHGAKGGAYARLAPMWMGENRPKRVYTPHGGSLHYSHLSPKGAVFLGLERFLRPLTDLFLFESGYGRDAYSAKIGKPRCAMRVVHNGLQPDEFDDVPLDDDPADILFIGELRELKGVDTLIEAAARLDIGRRPHLVIVGAGPDEDAIKAHAACTPDINVLFHPPMPARRAFAKAGVVAVPSRAESLPYVVLEAIAAGRIVVATDVGGIPEIFGRDRALLVPPDDAARLAEALSDGLSGALRMSGAPDRIRDHVRTAFSLEAMADGVMDGYREVLTETPDVTTVELSAS